MKRIFNNSFIRWAFLVLLVLVLVLFLLVAALMREYQRVERLNIRSTTGSPLHPPARHTALTVKDIDLIEPWTTFEYVNYLFNIPGNYLREEFNIRDIRYPKIPLSRYADENGISQELLLQKVKDAVRGYLAAH